jgi:Kef-type K+ transport system membrane component KefB
MVFLVAALIVVPVFKRLGLSSVLGYLAAAF